MLWEARLAAIMFRMNGISRLNTWQGLFPTTPCISSILGGQMCGAIVSGLHPSFGKSPRGAPPTAEGDSALFLGLFIHPVLAVILHTFLARQFLAVQF